MPQHWTIDWFPLLPGWVVALVAAALVGVVLWGSLVLARKQIPQRWIVRLGLLRTAAVLLFVLFLLQPVFSYLARDTRPPELLVLVDASQSMSQVDGDDGRTRLAAALDDLRRTKLLDRLQGDYAVRWFGFDGRAFPLDAAELNSLEPRGGNTNLARSLASASELWSAEHGDGAADGPRRVLLVSDGQDRGDADFAATAAGQGTIVDVLPAGGERKSTSNEAVIVEVQAAPRVLLASETEFLVTVERHGDAAQDYELTLYEDGRAALTQEVKLAAGTKQQRVRTAYRPTEVGLKRFEFALKPLNAKTEPPADERYGVNVQVVDEKIEVLVLEDRWRWDFKYFKRVLEDDPSFNLTAMLARGGGAFLQLGEPERSVNLGGFPQSRAELDWFDVVVLGDVRPSQWPSGLSGAIADAVIEGGKSLVVIAGPALGEIAQSAELQVLLPVDVSAESAVPIEGPLEVQLTPEGAASSLLADAAAEGKLPVVDRIYPAIRKRPAATVLVEAAAEANAAGRLILLAEQRVGRGRVLFVATDALWKWHTLATPDAEGRTPYGVFWQQTLRALTPNRTAAAAGLWLSADRTRYETGDRVRLQIDAPLVNDNERAKLEGAIVVPDGRRLPLAIEPDPTTADAYRAEFDAVAPGRYRVSLAATVDGQAAAETSAAVEVVAARGETDDASVDRAALAEIARRTGGRVLDPDDESTWPTAATAAPPEVDVRRHVNLADNFVLLTLLCLVLGGDWLARLLRGYV